MVWHVRRAFDDDAEPMSALHADSFADAWPGKEWRRYISEMNQAGAVSTLVLVGHRTVDSTDVLSGMVLARRVVDEAEVLTIVVGKTDRRQGLARELVTGLIKELSAHLPCRLFLEVSVMNTAALKLYETLGFQLVGTRPGYYRSEGGKPVDASILALELTD